MTIQQGIFAEELNSIQQRHALFFQKDQLEMISMVNEGSHYSLKFLPDLQLPTEIIREIEFAFKLAQTS